MGQIFHACAYDIENKTCCVIDSDKFHANCYSHSGSVLSMHYLLRQKPYHIMWGGGYVVIDDNLEGVSRNEELLGISTYENYEGFEMNNPDIKEKSYYDKVKFIEDNSRNWTRIDVWDEAISYFNADVTHSVKYSGYLINHSKKLAVSLEKYYLKSFFTFDDYKITTIDLVPVLTETGGGAIMAFYDGVTAESTEQLAGTWCGDLMQIVDAPPEGYTLINCCFASIWHRAKYCYKMFGIDSDSYLIENKEGKRFAGAALNLLGKRGPLVYLKAEILEERIRFTSVPVEKIEF